VSDVVSATITLFHVSDLHFGAEDRAALDWFAGRVTDEKPHAVVCTGDLTMRGRRREFAAAGEWLSGLGVPVSVEPGNHDMPYYWNPLARLLRPFERFREMHAHVHSELELDDVALVPLKTIAPAQFRLNWSKGRIADDDLTTTVRQVESSPATLRLVACHHPLVDADTHSTGSTRGGGRALAALAGAGADAVLSGHVHDPFDMSVTTESGAIRLIGAGTLSERLRDSRPSYNRLEWDGTTLDVRAEHLN
jgi:3',5'-cyclic AMP phosphodiesterase CpdA